jgi:hypothetical protein
MKDTHCGSANFEPEKGKLPEDTLIHLFYVRCISAHALQSRYGGGHSLWLCHTLLEFLGDDYCDQRHESHGDDQKWKEHGIDDHP